MKIKECFFFLKSRIFYKFWMKDMEFSVDIIFIKGDRISQIYTNAEVPSDSASLRLYPSSESVDKVLEIKGGLANKYNFKVGDKIEVYEKVEVKATSTAGE